MPQIVGRRLEDSRNLRALLFHVCRFSQIPDIGSMWWLSYVATIMSFAYAFIGLGLAIHKTAEKGHADYGTLFGMAHEQQTVNATWNTFNALGSMAFAYSFVSLLHASPAVICLG